jgi:hypothetical protein
MKITRLRKSYRLSLSHAEFGALVRLVELGGAGVENDADRWLSGLSPATKRAVLKVSSAGMKPSPWMMRCKNLARPIEFASGAVIQVRR